MRTPALTEMSRILLSVIFATLNCAFLGLFDLGTHLLAVYFTSTLKFLVTFKYLSLQKKLFQKAVFARSFSFDNFFPIQQKVITHLQS